MNNRRHRIRTEVNKFNLIKLLSDLFGEIIFLNVKLIHQIPLTPQIVSLWRRTCINLPSFNLNLVFKGFVYVTALSKPNDT